MPNHERVIGPLHQWSLWSRQDRAGPRPPSCGSMASRFRPEAGDVPLDPHDRDKWRVYHFGAPAPWP
jgi:hypothetical protein